MAINVPESVINRTDLEQIWQESNLPVDQLPGPDASLVQVFNRWIYNQRLDYIKVLLCHPKFKITSHQTSRLLKSCMDYPEALRCILELPIITINAQDIYGATALGWATFRGHDAYYCFFERRDINLHVVNFRNQNVLFFCRSPRHAKLLLMSGIRYAIRDNEGRLASQTVSQKVRKAIHNWDEEKERINENLDLCLPKCWAQDLGQVIKKFVFKIENNI